MPDLVMEVDVALGEVPVNLLPLLDDTDYKSREVAVAFNAAGMDLVWNFTTTDGSFTQTAVTPTSGGVYDWAHQGDGMYTIEIPASGGGSINNNAVGIGWFTGFATGVLPWRGPTIQVSPANVVNSLVNGTDLLDANTTQWGGTAVGSALVRGNVIQWTGTNVTAPDTAGSPKVTLTSGTGTGQISLSSGAVLLQATQTGVTIPTVTAVTNQVTANVTGISGDATAADNLEAALDGTGGVTITAALTGAITGNITGNLSGSVGSVTGAVGSVTGNVGGNVVGSAGSVVGAVGSVTGNVGGNVVGSVGSVTGAVGSVTGAVGSVTGNVGGNVVGSVGSVTTVSDKTGYALSAAGVDAVLDEVVEGTITFRQMLRLFGAALGGELSGAATTTIVIRNASDSKTVITATCDSDGNRSAMSLDLT